ncbi:MAG: radical SAM protein [Zoogloeaceae bacterium]|jgi:wyosine [tRNA(Phe)-imidazoG37] synthetase (radical SAM superfamily)|nr:radical SAM protein [Zoogloeaceae bacterium]
MLTVSDHDRDLAGLVYVYPVLSRRAGGVSVGINLNPNNACNWRCAYCQVPDLTRGKAPKIDLDRLEAELRGFLTALCRGEWLARNAPEGARALKDLAFSGNGEPTSAAEFADAVALAARVRAEFALERTVALRLISNGSLLARAHVREGIRRLAQAGGEVWFKLDTGRADTMAKINGVRQAPHAVIRNLAASKALCPTWVQTCVFRWDGQPPDASEIDAYLDMLGRANADGGMIEGVLLYGVARPPLQPEGARISPLSAAELAMIVSRIEEKGLTVRVSP